MSSIDTIYSQLKLSKKYKYLCDETLFRISQWSDKRYKGKKAVKGAKKKLHQVYGAYFESFHPRKIQEFLDQLSTYSGQEAEILSSITEQILDSHISTSERLPYIRQFYRDLFKQIEKPRYILDLACGLNTFTRPWIDLEPGAEYHAYDIDTRLIEILNRYFSYIGPSYHAYCSDILVTLPPKKADLVFLLKTLPCLEQQEKGISEKIIAQIKAKHMVVSFPSQTLTGKTKGMEDFYRDFIMNIIRRLNLDFFELEYDNENFYIINKKP